jgi:alkanesulfonate monooxygenase SsuD/methylene tetrahydromethanopterin reductase-like flavin-dependent oxidoreductase (luciferase family)
MTSKQSTRPAKIGLILPAMEKNNGISSWADIRDMAELAEGMGFDSLWVVDHFLYKLENDDPPKGAWECWSILSALAACTKNVNLGTLVLGMGFRNPALLAKMADTVDEISGGRLILGIGAGYHKYEYDAFGYPFDYKFSRFEEGIQILHSLLKTGKVDFEGRFHSARECELKPRGPRSEGPPIMVGGRGPKMLRAVGRYADVWNGFWDDVANSPAGFAKVSARIDEACEEVGRDPATLARSASVLIADPSAEPWWEDMPFDNDADLGALKPLFGEPEEIAETLRQFVAEGVSSIQIHLDPTTPQAVERLAPVLEAFDAG